MNYIVVIEVYADGKLTNCHIYDRQQSEINGDDMRDLVETVESGHAPNLPHPVVAVVKGIYPVPT